MKTTRKISNTIIAILKGLSDSEIKEIVKFAVYLKSRSVMDLEQAYFWTSKWQTKERVAGRDKKAGHRIGDGTAAGLLDSLHS